MKLITWIKNNIWDKKSLYLIVNADSERINKIPNKVKRERLTIIAWIYFVVLSTLILLSLLTLIFSGEYLNDHASSFYVIEIITVVFLMIDYVIKWRVSSAFVTPRQKYLAYILFPFKPLSIILLLGIIPVLYLIGIQDSDNGNNFWVVLRIIKLIRLIRILAIATMIPSLGIFTIILRKNKSWLTILFFVVIVVVLLFALTILIAEDSYYSIHNIPYDKRHVHDYWEAIYYCVVSITTIGYGDVTAMSDLGKSITIVMAITGVILLTLPTSLIAGSFITELHNMRNSRKNKIVKLGNWFLHSDQCKCNKCVPNIKTAKNYDQELAQLKIELNDILRQIDEINKKRK